MSKILVTGASGFVGKSLVPALLARGHQVLCAVNKPIEGLQTEQVVVKPLQNLSDWRPVLQGVEVVIHLAARVHIMQDKSASPWDEYYKVNSQGTQHLALQAAECGVKRFVFLSSIKVLGEETAGGNPYDELCTTQPEDPYGQSKVLAEEYLHQISQSTAMEITILRPPLVYGPWVKGNFLNMLKWTHKGIPLPFAEINNKRTFVYIENLISALWAAAEHPDAANQIYLVSDDESWSLAGLMNEIALSMNVRSPLFSVPPKFLTLLFQLPFLKKFHRRLLGSLEVSNKKIKSQLGWMPISSVDGLKNTAKWYQNEYMS